MVAGRRLLCLMVAACTSKKLAIRPPRRNKPPAPCPFPALRDASRAWLQEQGCEATLGRWVSELQAVGQRNRTTRTFQLTLVGDSDAPSGNHGAKDGASSRLFRRASRRSQPLTPFRSGTTRTLFEAFGRELVCEGNGTVPRTGQVRPDRIVVDAGRGRGRVVIQLVNMWGCKIGDHADAVKAADAVVFSFGLHMLHLAPARSCGKVDSFTNACAGEYAARVKALAAEVEAANPSALLFWRTTNSVCSARYTRSYAASARRWAAFEQV